MKYLLIPLSLILMYIISVACGGGDWYEEEYEWSTRFFDTNVGVKTEEQKKYIPFLFDAGYYGNENDEYSNLTLFNEQNVEEWSDFLNKKVPDAELNQLLYSSSLEDIDALIFYIKDNKYTKITDTLKKYNICKPLNKQKAKDFLYYLGFARRCESVSSLSDEGEWDYRKNIYIRPQSFTEKYVNDLISGGLNAMPKTKTAFIKERYAFQICRLYFQKAMRIDHDFEACATFFEKNKTVFSVSPSIYYRSLGYVAAAYHHSEQYAEANLLYARIYAEYPPMRVQAQFSFHPQEETDFARSVNLAQNNKEKSALWMLLGLYSQDELRALKEIYAFEPHSELLNLLLIKYLSNMERRIYPALRRPTPYNQGYYKADNDSYIAENALETEVVMFFRTVAQNNNTENSYLWDIAAGYVYFIKQDFAEARKYFSKAQSKVPSDKRVKRQLEVFELMMKVDEQPNISLSFESQFAQEFHGLFSQKTSWGNETTGQMQNAKTYILFEMAQKYLAQGDTVKAVCCDPFCVKDYYTDTDNISNIIDFLEKKDKTLFENTLDSIYIYSADQLYESQAIKFAYDGDLNKSLEKFKKGNAGAEILHANPFNIRINDCHDCDFELPQKRKFSKLDFITELKKMEDIVAQKTSYTDCFLLANGYYNMTYFGNARTFYQNIIDNSNYGIFYFPLNTTYNKVSDMTIFDCTKAEYYYIKAADATTDREKKAKCYFMAAKCEQNRYFCNKDSKDDRDFVAGAYFQKLKAEYSNTVYYSEIIQECGYFRKYAGK